MKSNIIRVLLVSLAFEFTSCDDNDEATINCDGVSLSFADDVLPVIQANCAITGCHPYASSNGPGALTNYSQIFAARTAIKSAVASGSMPKGSTLSSNEKTAIICWVESGAADN